MAACSKPELWRPWESHHLNLNICRICHSGFRRVGELKRHCKSCHFPKFKICCICNEHFTRKDNLTRHMKSKHDDTFKATCEFCKKPLSRQDSAARHQKTCQKNPNRRPTVIVSLTSLKTQISHVRKEQ